MHSVVNLPWETFRRLKTMSRHSIGWVALISSRKWLWNWTGIYSAIAGRSRRLATRDAWEGSNVAASTPATLAMRSRTAAP